MASHRVSEEASSLSISCSVVPSSVEYGIGSDAGRCMMAFGEFLEAGIHAVLIRHRLSSIKARLRNGSVDSVANNEKVCGDLLELSRRGLYSAKVKRKAWSLIFLFISEGEIDGLLGGIIKWREIEIKIFLQEAVKQMPNDWIFDPLSHHKTSGDVQKTFPQLQDNSKLAMGLLRLLSSLMKNGHLVQGTKKNNGKRESPTLSLTSFVSASGKMVLGPLAFQVPVKVHISHHYLPDIVKSIVCGRLNTISTRLRVEVASDTPSKEMVGLFSELFLIYRLFSGDRTIYRQTRELFFVAISKNHALAMSRVLASWSREDLMVLLAEVAPWMWPFVNAGCTIDSRFPKAFRAYLASHPNTRHPILPFLHFLVQLAHASEPAACLLLDIDVIRMLKLLCIHDFPNPAASVISTTLRMDRIASSDVYGSLILLFAALSSHPKSSARMMHMRNIPFWFLSVYYTPDFLGLPHELLLQSAWKDLEKPAMKLVLVALEHVLKGEDVRDNVDFLPLVNIYRDLISVLRDPTSGPEMLYSAADSLLTCIEFGGDFRRILDTVLAEGRLEDTITIIRITHKSLAPDFPPFPPINGARLRLGDAQRYLTCLAHSYAHELRMFSPLVGELFGSPACDARYSLAGSEKFRSIIFARASGDDEDFDSIMNT